jgi:DNA invertase Pin-like site-specific DNA recombinase
MRLVSYTRVSTVEQANSGLGLDAQAFTINSAATSNGWSIVRRCVDAGVSSVDSGRRHGLHEALALAESDDADGIVVAKLDRLSRSVSDFANLLCRAQANGWRLVILDIGLDLGTPMGTFVANIMCSVAQLERELIRQRTRDALAAARARGIRTGPPSKVPAVVAETIHLHRKSGATLTAIADALNVAGTPTATGSGRWHPASVRAVLNRPVALTL